MILGIGFITLLPGSLEAQFTDSRAWINGGTSAAGTLVSSGAQLQIEGNLAIGNQYLALAGTGSDRTLNGTIPLNSLTKEGASTLTVVGKQNYVTTTVTAGTYQSGASNILGNQMTVSLGAGGTFDVNGQTDTIQALTGSGTLLLARGAHLTVGANVLAEQDKQGQIPMNQITFAGYSNHQTIWPSYDDQITVPEPGTYGLALRGGLLAWPNLRRRPRGARPGPWPRASARGRPSPPSHDGGYNRGRHRCPV